MVRAIIIDDFGIRLKPHPAVKLFADTIKTAPQADRWPLLYVDRRGSPLHRLKNECEIAEQLEAIGFCTVRLESLSIAEQIALVRQAEVIVAPHGAGLTHVKFARPGLQVLEILPRDGDRNYPFDLPPLATCRGIGGR